MSPQGATGGWSEYGERSGAWTERMNRRAKEAARVLQPTLEYHFTSYDELDAFRKTHQPLAVSVVI